MKKTILVGAGRRVRDNILPALIHGREFFDVTGVYARSERVMTVCGTEFAVENFETDLSARIAECDVIIVCVTVKQVPAVLKRLLENGGSDKTIFIDTPVFAGRNVKKAKLLGSFSRVYVLEDWIGLAHFRIVKDIIQNGHIGAVKEIIFQHGGYRNHALAAVRNWTTAASVRRIRRRKLFAGFWEFRITDAAGVKTRMLEPRNYRDGTFLIIGDKGSIANYELDSENHHFIDTQLRDGVLTAECAMPDRRRKTSIPFHEALIESLVEDGNLMNLLKTQSVLDMLRAPDMEGSALTYTASEAVYDKFMIDRACRHGFFFDVPMGRSSVIKSVLVWLSERA